MVVQNIQGSMDLEDLTMNWMDLDLTTNFDSHQRLLVEDTSYKAQQDDGMLPQNFSHIIGNYYDDGCEDELPFLSTGSGGPADLMEYESFLSSPELLRIESDENSSSSFSTTSDSLTEAVSRSASFEKRFLETLCALESSMKRSQETRRRLSSKFVHADTFQNALSSVESSTRKLHECFFCNKNTPFMG